MGHGVETPLQRLMCLLKHEKNLIKGGKGLTKIGRRD